MEYQVLPLITKGLPLACTPDYESCSPLDLNLKRTALTLVESRRVFLLCISAAIWGTPRLGAKLPSPQPAGEAPPAANSPRPEAVQHFGYIVAQ